MKIYYNRSDYLFLGLLRLFVFYLIFLFIMLCARTFFLFYFGQSQVWDHYFSDVMYAFYMGWRYDSLVISYMMAPLYLFLVFTSMLKSRFLLRVYNFGLRSFLLFFGLVVPAILISDLGFYSFFQDHINILFFGLFEDDTKALIATIQKNYPIVPILVGLLLYIVALFFLGRSAFPRWSSGRSIFHKGVIKYLVILLSSFVLLVGGMRGGYSMMVLSPQYNDFSENEFINQMAMNGVVALEKTIKLRVQNNHDNYNMTQAMGYGDNIHQAYADYLGFDVTPTPREQLTNLLKRETPKSATLKRKKFHVVVLVMESFGGSWLKYHSEKFNILGDLEQHFNSGVYFPHFISADNGTIGSLLTVATGIPMRPGKRFLSESKYLQMPLESSANIPYQRNGYETSFVYGGKLGWRDIGKYFRYQGYDHQVGESKIRARYKLTEKSGTEWGLYDEHFFEYIYDGLKKSKRPQFVIGLSTSNHPPFEVPQNYQLKPLVIPTELESRITREKELFISRFQAFQYSNQALANFINKIKTSSLGERTVIAVVGDHNFWGFMNYEKKEMFSKYTVPFYLYLPKEFKVKGIDTNKIGSHEDVMSTIYNLTLSNTEYISFGEDLFSNEKSHALNPAIYATDDGVIYKGKSYHWNHLPLVDSTKEVKKLDSLDKLFRSTVTVSDHFLDETYKKQKKKTN